MPSRALVLDANILSRAVLGQRVRRILETHADAVSFFVTKTACEEAEEHLAALVVKRGGDPVKALTLLKTVAALGTLVSQIFMRTSKAKHGDGLADAILDWPILATALGQRQHCYIPFEKPWADTQGWPDQPRL